MGNNTASHDLRCQRPALGSYSRSGAQYMGAHSIGVWLDSLVEAGRMRAHLTQERLKELLHYDPATGIFTWRRAFRGGVRADGVAGTLIKNKARTQTYRRIYVEGRRRMAHALAWLYVYGEEAAILDHIDRDGLNNRIDNLRICDKSQNGANSGKKRSNTSGYKGVTWSRNRGKWVAQLTVRRKQICIGYFDDPVEAHSAYASKAKELLGDFACVA